MQPFENSRIPTSSSNSWCQNRAHEPSAPISMTQWLAPLLQAPVVQLLICKPKQVGQWREPGWNKTLEICHSVDNNITAQFQPLAFASWLLKPSSWNRRTNKMTSFQISGRVHLYTCFLKRKHNLPSVKSSAVMTFDLADLVHGLSIHLHRKGMS